MTDVGKICADWRRTMLYPSRDSGKARKARAELRRADNSLAILSIEVVHRLHKDLVANSHDLRRWKDGPDRLGLIAVAMAHVKEPGGAAAAHRFGAGDPKPLSGLRFDALIRAHSPRAMLRPLTRALAIVDGSVDASALARDLFWWNDNTRANWCFDYHGAFDAKPDAQEETLA